ncbi:hypothetical protein Bca52824_022956 [Brassica carinata]|uniref:Uncharacterized protein n=1 Tax=Brassica carinata TaxID=52824 RepID=A0A8X7VHB3_BRACI|nr:hypothetical protein Bca52824_022956 [Brassica carinata]
MCRWGNISRQYSHDCYIALGPLLCAVVCLCVPLGGDGTTTARNMLGNKRCISRGFSQTLFRWRRFEKLRFDAIIKGMSYFHQRPRLISLISYSGRFTTDIHIQPHQTMIPDIASYICLVGKKIIEREIGEEGDQDEVKKIERARALL